MQGIGQPLLRVAVEHNTLTQALVQLLPKEIAQRPHFLLIARQVGLRRFTGLAKGDVEYDVLRTGASSKLMPGPVNQGLQGNPRADVEGSDAFRRIHFVASDREKIDPQL